MSGSSSIWPLQAAELAELVDGVLVGDPGAEARRAVTDTREGVRKGDLFVGLVGHHFDGGRFAEQALADNASICLVEAKWRASLEPALREGAATILVDDPLGALQALAAEARARFQGTVVAITGSNGKTVVKDMLSRSLGADVLFDASPLSYNSQVGVPLSVLGLRSDVDVWIVECGISLPGEMERLQQVTRPCVGVWTNVGDAHREGLGGGERSAAEKAQLFSDLPDNGFVVHPKGSPLIETALGNRVRRVEAGSSAVAFLDAATICWPDGARVNLPEPIASSEVWGSDALLAAIVARFMGAGVVSIEEGLGRWQPVAMRMETFKTPQGVLVINDTYTSDPTSVRVALRTLVAESGEGLSIAILGGVAGQGDRTSEAHRELGQLARELGVDRLIGIGPGGAEIVAAADLAQDSSFAASTLEEALVLVSEWARGGDRVLLKGARPARLEQLAEALFDGLAPARLYVNVDGVIENFRRIRREVGLERGIMPVIKSFGYGLDAVRIARALENAGAEYFGVAYPDEGIHLREHGITRPILVQNVLPHEMEKIVRSGLTAQAGSLEQIAALDSEARRHRRVVRVHLKIDTGMGRAGVFPEQAVTAAKAVELAPWLELEGVMTHFAGSDEPHLESFTRSQASRFADVVSALEAEGVSPRWIHACNSGALGRYPLAYNTMVRAGIGLYGYSVVEGRRVLDQEPVLRLVTRVISVKDVPAGYGVGYGLTWHADEPRRVAVVALGYNDGYLRALSNRGWMSVRGVRAPVIGRVCMDVTMLDVSDVPGDVRVGDEVVAFGPGDGEPDLVDVARKAGTIAYEMLTRLSPRVRRIYLQEER